MGAGGSLDQCCGDITKCILGDPFPGGHLRVRRLTPAVRMSLQMFQTSDCRYISVYSVCKCPSISFDSSFVYTHVTGQILSWLMHIKWPKHKRIKPKKNCQLCPITWLLTQWWILNVSWVHSHLYLKPSTRDWITGPLFLGPEAVWTKGGLVISEPQLPQLTGFTPPPPFFFAVERRRPELNKVQGDKGIPVWGFCIPVRFTWIMSISSADMRWKHSKVPF